MTDRSAKAKKTYVEVGGGLAIGLQARVLKAMDAASNRTFPDNPSNRLINLLRQDKELGPVVAELQAAGFNDKRLMDQVLFDYIYDLGGKVLQDVVRLWPKLKPLGFSGEELERICKNPSFVGALGPALAEFEKFGVEKAAQREIILRHTNSADNLRCHIRVEYYHDPVVMFTPPRRPI